MREIGGYIELEHFAGREYHSDAIALNCCRNCLDYIIKAKKIKKVYVPAFTCSSVPDVCKRAGAEYEYYHIDADLRPDFSGKMELDEWLLIIDYYGQLSDEDILRYNEKYGRIILDCTQSFFRKPLSGIDYMYTCRKFFGVADGAYLYTDTVLSDDFPVDYSYDRMHFLLGRYEKGANEFYGEYVANNSIFRDESIKFMSELTHNFMRAIDYEKVCIKRNENYSYLADSFSGINRLNLRVPEGAFMYPLLIDNGKEVRSMLQKNKIYIPTLWPDVFKICSENELEYDLAMNILPLPVDQRYTEDDMKYLVKEVMSCIS